MSVGGHPDREQLIAYRDGRVSGVEANALAIHLAECPACVALLDSLPDDHLVGVLRSIPASLNQAVAGVPAELASHPRYELQGELGRGGMGVVYRARHTLLDREVAVKVVDHRLATSPTAIHRFLREAQSAARLDHPNIVQVHDAEQVGETVFLVMELVPGIDLGRAVRERGSLPSTDACDCVRQAALGLQHAHERGLIHRDIKPSNLILTPEGVVKLVDFGLATLLDRDEPPNPADVDTPVVHTSLTRLGRGLGTADYVAPEQAVDARMADARSDIYSLGATLYHLLAGRPPFTRDDASRTVLGHMVETPPPLGQFRTDLLGGLLRVVSRMMAKNPASRFQTATEVASALAPFAGGRLNRRRFVVGAVATSAMLLAGGVGWLTWRNSPRWTREVSRFEPHPGSVQGLALSPDESTLLTGCDDHRLRWFDVNTPTPLRVIDAHDDWVVCVAFMPDGRRALSGSTDGSLRLWELETGRLLHRFGPHEATVVCIAVTADGTRAVVGTDNRLVRVWDIQTGRLLHRLEGHFGPVQCVAVSDDGQVAFSAGNDRSVRAWDIVAGRETARLVGHEHIVGDLLLLPDGQLLTASHDQTTRLWNWAEGRQLAVRGYPLRMSRVFRRNGRDVAVGCGEGGECRLYDATTGTEWCRLGGHRATLWGFAVSRDGQRAITADRAGEVIVSVLPEWPG